MRSREGGYLYLRMCKSGVWRYVYHAACDGLDMRWHTGGAGWCVTCVWRASDVIKMWVYEQELGDRYIWQGEHSRRFGNHEGAWSKQMDWWNHMGTCKVNRFTSRSDLGLGGQLVPGAVPDLLRRIWGYINDLHPLWDMYDVIIWLPCILGDGCSCCLTSLGGSESEQRIMVK